MAVSYRAPGVYVEDVPPAQRAIEGASTSVAAFAGVVGDDVTMPQLPDGTAASLAAAGEVQRLDRWEEFELHFGTFGTKNSVLSHAVFGFFLNGGSHCYVTRVAKADDLANLSAITAAWAAYDDISIVAVPGATSKAQHQALTDHCALMRDRVAVLDGAVPATAGSTKPTDIRPTGLSTDGGYAALYYPWIQTAGPDSTGTLSVVPPSGHVAGIYARSDSARGVFKAPANEPVRGAVDVSARLGRLDQETLNPEGINVLRPITGAVTVWGARTLSNQTDFRYVSVRRYLCYLRDTLTAGTAWAVFEPNGLSLWKSLARNVSDFLRSEWQSGALLGETPEKAFYVRCDEATNPPASRELGRVVVEIGVAVVRPAEFVVIRVQQSSGE